MYDKLDTFIRCKSPTYIFPATHNWVPNMPSFTTKLASINILTRVAWRWMSLLIVEFTLAINASSMTRARGNYCTQDYLSFIQQQLCEIWYSPYITSTPWMCVHGSVCFLSIYLSFNSGSPCLWGALRMCDVNFSTRNCILPKSF